MCARPSRLLIIFNFLSQVHSRPQVRSVASCKCMDTFSGCEAVQLVLTTIFYNALQVFVNVILSVNDMMSLGKASAVGWKTIGLYLLTTIAACLMGIIGTLIMKGSYEQKIFEDGGPAYVSFGCNEEGAYLAEMDDGSVMCTANYGNSMNIEFIFNDVSNTFVKKSSGARNDISLSDTVYDGVFRKLM